MVRLVNFEVVGPMLLSAVSHPELRSAVVRLRSTGYLSALNAQRVLAAIEREWVGIEEEPITKTVLQSAANLIDKHELRTLDAIQLASALASRDRARVNLRFASADRKLLTAAGGEGFVTFDPCASMVR